ncbi:hypothetical protein [Oleispirillum naphthae]|uniref:hypothetical protein n=1 Tax=Oleispirillum naphthae TaxID=2838853 RepID=UPI003082444E
MNIKIGSFILETYSNGIFLRLPLIGQAFISRDPGFRAWDSWSALRASGEVR